MGATSGNYNAEWWVRPDQTTSWAIRSASAPSFAEEKIKKGPSLGIEGP